MQLFAVVSAALAILAAPVLGAPAPVQLKSIERVSGAVKPSSYIVKLKSGVSKEEQLEWLEKQGSSRITHNEWKAGVINGFAGVSAIRSVVPIIYR